jgi:hypothetical protein
MPKAIITWFSPRSPTTLLTIQGRFRLSDYCDMLGTMALSETLISNAYWVLPGQLLAGEYPRDWDDKTSQRRLDSLLAIGVNFFLDLTEEREPGVRPYLELARDLAAGLGRPLGYQRRPIRDFDVPSPAQMVDILDTIDAALTAGNVIYVHCYGGIGRTGTVVGCYLVRHGLDGPSALTRLAQLRRDTPAGARLSPETEAQRQLVLNWRAGI